MKEKFLQLMKSEGLTSSRMAEILEIQPSGISHILSGRNKPGFDLLQKILRRFPRVNPDWLLLDSGQMYRTEFTGEQSQAAIATSAAGVSVADGLFGTELRHPIANEDRSKISSETTGNAEQPPNKSHETIHGLADVCDNPRNPIVRVVLIYADRSFEALTLHKQ